MAGTQIPLAIEEFFTYMATTDAYSLTGTAPNQYWNRWNWLTPEQAAWHGFAVQAAAYKLQYDAKSVNMTDLRTKIHLLIQQVHTYNKTNHLLERISLQSPTLALLEDFTTFNITHNAPVVGGGLPTERRTATTKLVYFDYTLLPNGDIKFICRSILGSKHASVIKDYEIGVMYKELANADETTTPITPSEKAPTSTTQLTQFITSTHARFTMHLGSDASNHRLAISMYWKHKTNAALDGPQSIIQVFTIS